MDPSGADPEPNPCPGVVFVDCEATGLAHPSYPISLGLAWCDGRSEAILVRPHRSWDSIAWDPAAMTIHRLTPSMLEADGRDVQDAARWMNERVSGLTVCSDAPSFEAYWLGALFSAAGIAPAFGLFDAEEADLRAMSAASGGRMAPAQVLQAYELATRRATRRFPHTHRADEDALQRAMIHREAVEAARSA